MYAYGYRDWEYLTMALACGGAVDIQCPAARASLTRAGLMVPAPNTGRDQWHPHHRAKKNMMALTKAGQRRAEEVRRQMLAHRPATRRLLRKARNVVINKNENAAHRMWWLWSFTRDGV